MGKWAIFKDYKEAKFFSKQDNKIRGYPKPGCPATPLTVDGQPGYGWTIKHADILKHPAKDLWAYPIDGCKVTRPPEAEILEADLTNDWFPDPDFLL